MSAKEKILEVLDCALDDLSEERLLEILLDAYQEKRRTIANLEHECTAVRRQLHDEKERIRDEHARMRNDPLYTATGEYFFYLPRHDDVKRAPDKYIVAVKGQQITMRVSRDRYCQLAQQISRAEFLI
jgi:hypothetical protein